MLHQVPFVSQPFEFNEKIAAGRYILVRVCVWGGGVCVETVLFSIYFFVCLFLIETLGSQMIHLPAPRAGSPHDLTCLCWQQCLMISTHNICGMKYFLLYS